MIDKLKLFFWMSLACICGVLVIVLAVSLYVTTSEKDEAVLALSEARKTSAEYLVVSQAKARLIEQNLVASAAETRKETSEQTAAIADRRAALVRRVRHGEGGQSSGHLRLSSGSTATSLGGAAFRSEEPVVPGPLGEADVEEAARADLIRAHYLACEAQYERARTALKP